MKRVAELFNILATLTVVLVTSTVVLLAADAATRWLAGTPSGLIPCRDIEEAQHQVHARLLVPAYFPDSLAWPPARVELVIGPPATVALSFTGRDGGEEILRLVQVVDADLPPASETWPAATTVSTTRVTLDDTTRDLTRVLTRDGSFWHELHLTIDGRRVAFRTKGSIADLLRMAGNLEHFAP